MGTFVATYFVVWMGVALFVAHMGTHQRRLKRRLDQLRAPCVQRKRVGDDHAQAA